MHMKESVGLSLRIYENILTYILQECTGVGLLERLVLLHVEVDDGGGADEQQEAQRFPREPTAAGSKQIN